MVGRRCYGRITRPTPAVYKISNRLRFVLYEPANLLIGQVVAVKTSPNRQSAYGYAQNFGDLARGQQRLNFIHLDYLQ
jgi:hypothetical protein